MNHAAHTYIRYGGMLLMGVIAGALWGGRMPSLSSKTMSGTSSAVQLSNLPRSKSAKFTREEKAPKDIPMGVQGAKLLQLLNGRLPGDKSEAEIKLLLDEVAKNAPREGLQVLRAAGLLSSSVSLTFLMEVGKCNPNEAAVFFKEFPQFSPQSGALYEGMLAGSPELAKSLRPELDPNQKNVYTEAEARETIRQMGFQGAMQEMVIGPLKNTQKKNGTIHLPASVSSFSQNLAFLPTSEVETLGSNFFSEMSEQDPTKIMMAGKYFVNLLSQRDPHRAVEWAASVPEQFRRPVLMPLVDTWAQQDPDAVLDFIKNYKGAREDLPQLLVGLMNAVKDSDPDLAKEAASRLEEFDK